VTKFKSTLALLIVALFLTGCAGPVTNTSFSSGEDSAAVSDSVEIGKVESMSPDRQVIQSGSVTLRVDEITESIPAVIELAESLEGRVDDQSQYTDPTQSKVTNAYLLVRVPEVNYQAFLDEVVKFGNVESLNTSKTDVTLQAVDLDARIQSLETSIARLEELVTEANNVSDLIAAESALAERQAELNGLLSQQKYLDDQVELASIYVNLMRKDALDAIAPIGFWAGLQKGLESVLQTLGNSTTYLGLVLPWIGVVLLILVLAKLVRVVIKKVNK
jgi:uncharacterized coiled-coil protein SlyX